MPGISSAKATRVLTYHDFGSSQEVATGFTTPISNFLDQMTLLAENHTVQAMGSLKVNPAPEGDADICISIDDGFQSAISLAVPVLQKFQLPATFFVSTNYLGRKGYLNEVDLRELCDLGFEIGSHGCSHTSITSLSSDQGMNELCESKRALEDITGQVIEYFAYPYGTIRDFNELTDIQLAQAGYLAAFTSQHGSIGLNEHRFRLPRIKVDGGDSISIFREAVTGGLDKWIYVDRYLSRLQVPNTEGLPCMDKISNLDTSKPSI